MNLKKIFAILIILILFPLAAFAGETPAIKGAFSQAPGRQFRFDGKTVEVIEFMSFYCGHCYTFEKSIVIIKGNFPKKIQWKIVPIYWGKGSPKPSEAYLLAEDAGMGEQMKQALFHANFVEKRDIGDVDVLESIAGKLRLSFDFSRRLRTGEKADAVQKALDMARAYQIEETPTLIIAGNIMTDPLSSNHNMDAFRDNAISIIKSILKQ